MYYLIITLPDISSVFGYKDKYIFIVETPYNYTLLLQQATVMGKLIF